MHTAPASIRQEQTLNQNSLSSLRKSPTAQESHLWGHTSWSSEFWGHPKPHPPWLPTAFIVSQGRQWTLTSLLSGMRSSVLSAPWQSPCISHLPGNPGAGAWWTALQTRNVAGAQGLKLELPRLHTGVRWAEKGELQRAQSKLTYSSSSRHLWDLSVKQRLVGEKADRTRGQLGSLHRGHGNKVHHGIQSFLDRHQDRIQRLKEVGLTYRSVLKRISKSHFHLGYLVISDTQRHF